MAWHPFRERKERRLAELDAWRTVRRLAHEDVTVFGEELARLHEETLATPLDDEMRADYQQALDLYDAAKARLGESSTTDDVVAVEKVLEDGRFHLACVLARRDGVELPERREQCFFNPQHGPAVADVPWTPAGGVEREVPVCRRDRDRLTAGEAPDVRQVRVGDRYVPWWEAGGSTAAAITAHVHGGRAPHSSPHLAEAHTRSTITNAGHGGVGMYGP